MYHRPLPITIFTIVLFAEGCFRLLGTIIVVLMALSASESSAVFPLFFFTITGLASLISYHALWKMRRWCVWVFAAAWLLHYLVACILEKKLFFPKESIHDWFLFVLPAVYLGVVLPYWKKLE
jgi:hypothetical protein